MAEIAILIGNENVAAFRNRHPNGYVIMNGDRGIGLTGDYANTARNMGADPDAWVRFAAVIGPAIHSAVTDQSVA